MVKIKKHTWVTYSNPRNGRVKIKACRLCGISFAASMQHVSCEEKTPSEHRMLKLGWKILSAEFVEEAQTSEIKQVA